MDDSKGLSGSNASFRLDSALRDLLDPGKLSMLTEATRLTDLARSPLLALDLPSPSAFDALVRQMAGLDSLKVGMGSDSLLSWAASPASSTLLQAIGPLAEAHRSVLGNLEEVAGLNAGVALLFQRDSLGLARILDDVGTIAVRAALAEPPLAASFKGLAPRIGALADTLSALHRVAFDHPSPVGSRDPLIAEGHVTGVLLPTFGTQRFTSGMRGLLAPEEMEADDFRPRPHRGDDLEDLLAEINPRFARMLRGARQTLRSDGPDRFRQAAVSVRELMKQVLVELAPEDRFDAHELQQQGHRGHPTRKMRVRFIVDVGPEAVDWLEALAQAYEFSIRMLDGETHSDASEDSERRRISAESVIQSAEIFLRYLLANRRRI